MSTYLVLLRGVNVGGRSIKMAELKSCLEKNGFKNVRTILQSGNVLLDSNESAAILKPKIEEVLQENFNYLAIVQIRSLEELSKIIKACPFKDDETHHSYIIFFENGLEKQLASEANDIDPQIESIAVGKSVIYWQVPIGLTLKSTFAKHLTKSRYKSFNTNRNIRTLRKAVALAS